MGDTNVKIANDGEKYSVEEFIKRRYKNLYQLWKQMSAHELHFEEFFNFLMRRFEWTKSGSCLGGKGELDL